MPTVEQYEVEFLRGLQRAFEQWCLIEGMSFSGPSDEYDLVSSYLCIIRRFLNLELEEVERLYTDKYGSELIRFFIDYYSPSKLHLFVALVVHLVLEEDISLFFPTIEITGRLCGNWAIGHARDDEVGRLIERRVQHSVGRDGLADIYHSAYLDPAYGRVVPITERATHDKHPQATEDQPEKLLAGLLGASAATILLTTLAKCATRLFRMWVPSDSSTQSIFSVGCVPGSVKFYGFCAEKPKRMPDSSSTYRPLYREHIGGELAEVYDRCPIFIRFFTAFAGVEDPALLSLTSVDNGGKIWSVLQRFFWLITQPYIVSPKSVEETVQHFTHEVVLLTELDGVQPGLDGGQQVFGAQTRHELDPDLVLLTKSCLHVIGQEGIEVHSANTHVLADLAGSLS
ncbi:MAG TPA: hypothetical protein VMW58_01590 [Anaerolineae bacterium]|nr:hypothetical protein [Anaerolineae bacterium]